MKKLFFMMFFIVLCFASVNQTTAKADMGPKPSVVLNFTGLDNQTYYVTLLSKTSYSGPHSIEPSYQPSHEIEIAEKFRNYQDIDGYFFLNYLKECSNNSSFTWGYYPPNDFKILIYFPETDTFKVSELSYQAYAFNSYYKVDMTQEMNIIKDNVIAQDYNYSKEIINLILRIILTIIIEIAIAFLFMYRKKQFLKIIIITNIITQVALNIVINFINYSQGLFGVLFLLIPLELAIFAIEAVVYYVYFNKLEINKTKFKAKPVLYAFVANFASFVTGLLIYFFLYQEFSKYLYIIF